MEDPLWPSGMKNPQKFRGRKQANINEQAAMVDTGQVSFQEEEKRKGKMVGGSVNHKVWKGLFKNCWIIGIGKELSIISRSVAMEAV